MLCSYNCSQEALYQLKNGKWCCENSYNKCIAVKKKNSESTIKRHKFEKNHNIKRHQSIDKKFYKHCIYCNKLLTSIGFNQHIKCCYLNPDNIKLCPVCNTPIKDYKKSSTCSKPCSQIYFKDKFLNTSKNRDMSWVGENYKGPSYSLICFKYHKHKCIICDEDLAVDVHHYDKNDKNNKKENLVPLCATHHRYMHNKNYIYIIKECVDEYVFKFRKKLMVERNQ